MYKKVPRGHGVAARSKKFLYTTQAREWKKTGKCCWLRRVIYSAPRHFDHLAPRRRRRDPDESSFSSRGNRIRALCDITPALSLSRAPQQLPKVTRAREIQSSCARGAAVNAPPPHVIFHVKSQRASQESWPRAHDWKVRRRRSFPSYSARAKIFTNDDALTTYLDISRIRIRAHAITRE